MRGPGMLGENQSDGKRMRQKSLPHPIAPRKNCGGMREFASGCPTKVEFELAYLYLQRASTEAERNAAFEKPDYGVADR